MKLLPSDESFSNQLRTRDQALFLKLKGKPCPLCKSPLDAANFPRKTRGMGDQDLLSYIENRKDPEDKLRQLGIETEWDKY
mgnify:CR=1 FL=1